MKKLCNPLYLLVLLSFVTFPVLLKAQTNPVATQLNQIDSLQLQAAKLVPVAFTEKVSEILAKVNAWRESVGFYFQEKHDIIDHEMNLETLKDSPYVIDDQVQTKTDPNESVNSLGSLFKTLYQVAGLFFFSVMAFIFLTKYLFYFFAIIMIAVIIRVIFKMVFRGF